PGGPRLNFHDDFSAKFFGRCQGFVRTRGDAATRNLESVGGKNGFTLIFVESCHGSTVVGSAAEKQALPFNHCSDCSSFCKIFSSVDCGIWRASSESGLDE